MGKTNISTNNETTGMDVVHEVKYYEVRKTSMGA